MSGPDDDFVASLLVTFAIEAADHLQAMNRHLISLEADTDDTAARAELFRAAHSLKGAAQAVNLAPVEELAHQLEDIFERLNHDLGPPDQAVLNRTYHTLDAIAALVQAPTNPGDADPAVADPAASESGNIDPADTAGVSAAGGFDPAGPARPADGDWSLERPAVRDPRGGTVRVATAKLDALLSEVDELLATRMGVEQRLMDAGALEVLMAEWQSASGTPRAPERRGRSDCHNTVAGVMAVDSRTRLGTVRAGLDRLCRGMEADLRKLSQVTADLQDDVRRARMVSVAAVFEVFPRMVRDLAQASGKDVRFRIEGGQTEADRTVLDQLKDPLTHLLRNCLAHGVEKPAVRAQEGKPTHATISLSARQRTDLLMVEVSDDGAGIDPERVRAEAVRAGLLTAAAADDLADRDAIGLIFRSGMSTSHTLTGLSGRGVGLDVVRDAVQRLHGSVEVHSVAGAGTTFLLTLPLSLSTVHCLLVHAAGQTFALPAAAVQKVVRVPAPASQRTGERAGDGPAAWVGDHPITLARLADVLGADNAARDGGPVADGVDSSRVRPAVVVGAYGAQVALLVDRLSGTQELVVKSLPAPFARVRHIAGAAVLGTGEVALILNTTDLIETVELGQARPAATAIVPGRGPLTILIVEDSITTRTLEKNILETAGYQVEVAADGLAAWTVLGQCDCDLVVSDIQMPHMDGFELTAKIRADPRLRDLPVILVTSRDSTADHERGAEVGADAYIVKGRFDHDQLLQTIRRLT